MIYIVQEDEMFYRKQTGKVEKDLILNRYMKKEESEESMDEDLEGNIMNTLHNKLRRDIKAKKIKKKK